MLLRRVFVGMAIGAAAFGAVYVSQAVKAGAAKTQKPDLKPFYTQKLNLTPCEDKMQCAWLTVPRSYTTKNTHGTFRIRVIKDPATGTRAQFQGALIMNPGGPGGSGVKFIAHKTIDDARLHKAYDFVSFDPRGVGDSEPKIDCGLTNAQLDAINFTEAAPRTAQQRTALIRAYGAIGKDCAANDADVVKYVDTVSVARDIDVLRAALNESKVTWMGFSYGTKLGATYAELFPKRVRRMVLDGVVPTNTTYFDEGVEHARTEELGIKHYLETCPNRTFSDCPFSADPGQGEAKLVALLNSLRAHPVQVTTGRGTGFVDDGYLSQVIDEDGTGSVGDYPDLDALLAPAITKGDLGPIYNEVQDGDGRNPDDTYPDHGEHDAIFFSIKCIDSPTDESVKRFAAAAAAARKINPLTGEASVWSVATCLHWPYRTTMPEARFHNDGQPPILLIGSNHDFTTPLSWAESMAKQIKHSSLIRTDNYQHTSFAFGDPCVVDSTDTYLLTGKTPGKDVACFGMSKTPEPVH
jgi:pimeloyl-ACP methyl ester carboxylesterase